jgi:hypothetical protein
MCRWSPEEFQDSETLYLEAVLICIIIHVSEAHQKYITKSEPCQKPWTLSIRDVLGLPHQLLQDTVKKKKSRNRNKSYIKINQGGGWRNGSVVKRTSCSWVQFPAPTGASQPPVDGYRSSDALFWSSRVLQIHACKAKTLIH